MECVWAHTLKLDFPKLSMLCSLQSCISNLLDNLLGLMTTLEVVNSSANSCTPRNKVLDVFTTFLDQLRVSDNSLHAEIGRRAAVLLVHLVLQSESWHQNETEIATSCIVIPKLDFYLLENLAHIVGLNWKQVLSASNYQILNFANGNHICHKLQYSMMTDKSSITKVYLQWWVTPLNAEVMHLIWIALPLAAFGFVADFLHDSQQDDEVKLHHMHSN